MPNRPLPKFTNRLIFRVAIACTLFFALHCRVEAQSLTLNQRVLIVYNSADANSTAVANYYAGQRGIPAANLCPTTPPSTSLLAWSDYT
ncbi:MAG: hypothetical protein WBY44_32565, partial [Bryobacteraceae bacterium]